MKIFLSLALAAAMTVFMTGCACCGKDKAGKDAPASKQQCCKKAGCKCKGECKPCTKADCKCPAECKKQCAKKAGCKKADGACAKKADCKKQCKKADGACAKKADCKKADGSCPKAAGK